MARKHIVGVAAAPATTEVIGAELLDAYRLRLRAERDELVTQAQELEEAAGVGASGEVGFDEEFADAGTITFERERDLSLSQNAHDLIEKIERALDRMDHGTYGRCAACGQPIEPDRLDALPYAQHCLADARRRARLR
jgi:RNA polymerase-binding transcription factor